MTHPSTPTSPAPKNGWYARLFAWLMAHAAAQYEASMGDRKQSLFADIQGNVLEIGPGAGPNLSYYPKDIHWTGVEPNPYMHTYLHQEAKRLGLTVHLQTGTAERLDAEDNSLDAVVSTLVLCSVDNLEGTLQEVRRVLKLGGKFYFVEHVAAPADTTLRRVQQWIRPFWQAIGDGCRPDRETWKAIEQAGFQQVNYEKFRAPILAIVSPQIIGIALK